MRTRKPNKPMRPDGVPAQKATLKRQRAKLEGEIFKASQMVAIGERKTLGFDGKTLAFGNRATDDFVNQALKAVGSSTKLYTELHGGRGILILGPAEEELIDGAQVLIFGEDEIINICPPCDARTSYASRVVIMKKQIAAVIDEMPRIAKSRARGADPFYCDIVKHVFLSGAVFTSKAGLMESTIKGVAGHELGHIKRHKSGELNHTAFSNVVSGGQNTLRAINELLADLNAIKTLARQDRTVARKDLLKMMTSKVPLWQMKSNLVASMVFNSLAELFLFHVRPESLDVERLLEDVAKIEKNLLAKADSAALVVKDELVSMGLNPDRHLAGIKQDLRREGFPEDSIENFAWEIAYGFVVQQSPGIDRQIVAFLPKEEYVRDLFTFSQDGRRAWEEFLAP